MNPQQKWDIFLLNSFYKRPDIRMHKVTQIYNKDIEGLLRTPESIQHRFNTVCVFICNCLPKHISNYLWNHEITDNYSLAMTFTESIVTLEGKVGKFTRHESRELLSSRKVYEASCLSEIASAEMRAERRGSCQRGVGKVKKIKRKPRPNTNTSKYENNRLT